MDEYIKRDEILAKQKTLHEMQYGTGSRTLVDVSAVRVSDIESIPAADVRPVKSGEWIIRNSVYLQSGEVMATCSLCNNKLRILGNISDFTFCPNCGAYMQKED